MTKSQTTKKAFVIPLKKGIPLACAATNTSQHFLFSTVVASYCWDSVYFFQKLRNDGLVQFENNFFAEKRTIQQFNKKTVQLKKSSVIPLKKGIPLVCATTNTSQHFLFSTVVASFVRDSCLRRNDGVGQFGNLKMRQFENVFSSTKKLSTLRTLQTFNSKKLKTKSQQLKASKKTTLNFTNFKNFINFKLNIK